MARIGFGIALVASVAFLGWFLVSNSERPGLSFAIALIGMPLLLTGFGLSKSLGGSIPSDAKAAGWISIVIALLAVAYIASFFGSWLLFSLIWVGLHVPMIIALLSAPTMSQVDDPSRVK